MTACRRGTLTASRKWIKSKPGTGQIQSSNPKGLNATSEAGLFVLGEKFITEEYYQIFGVYHK
jgi:hypothetical protein